MVIPIEAKMFEVALRVVAVASVAHMFLPPYEVFDKFPNFQRYYAVLVQSVGYISLNARGKMIQAYPSTKSEIPPVDGGAKPSAE